jgi:2-polyprenyl-3-methyl-5-hydroxy-6-metoxy-1,4-benzoquinol methylase
MMIQSGRESICAHRDRVLLASYGSVDLMLCTSCGIVFSSRMMEKPAKAGSYDDFYKKAGAERFRFGVEFLVRLFRMARAVFLTLLAPEAGTILDVGSGRGWMLQDLKRKFHFRRTAGIQISRPAVEFSRKVLGLEIFDRDLLEVDFGRSRFDVVTLWHVLEHVRRPQETIRRCGQLLNPGGLLVVEVPNFNSWTCPWTLPYWLGFDPSRHMTFFTQSALTSLLERNGFDVRRTRTFSLEYSPFFSAQSILDRMTGEDQFFYRWLQVPSFSAKALMHVVLFCFLVPPCLLINLALFWTGRGEVLRVIARKKSGPKVPAGRIRECEFQADAGCFRSRIPGTRTDPCVRNILPECSRPSPGRAFSFLKPPHRCRRSRP